MVACPLRAGDYKPSREKDWELWEMFSGHSNLEIKIVFRRVADRSSIVSGLFPESRKGAQSPNLRAASLQVQLHLSF